MAPSGAGRAPLGGPLVVRLPNWLGDALMARPLLHALRAAQPGVPLRALAPAPLLALLARERQWDDAAPTSPGASEWPRSEPRPAAAVVLPPSFSSAWQAWRSGAALRVGFASDARSWLLTHAVRRRERGDRHLSREYLQLGEPLGVMPGEDLLPALPILAPTPSEFERAHELLADRGGVPERWVVFGPGAQYGPAKRWPIERFIALGRLLVARGLQVLACGGAGERAASEALVAGIGTGARSLAGSTDLGVQLALCARARLTVSNDSGLAHLAAASGAPTLALFGSTSSAWTAPLGQAVRVIQHAPVCSPCFQRDCRIGFACLHAIRVDELARHCMELAA